MNTIRALLVRIRTYVYAHRRKIVMLTSIVGVLLLLGALFVYNYGKSTIIVYKPINACERLTPAEAQDLLGDNVISVDTKKPVVSGNIATSKCSYTDRNPNQNSMKVAAVAIRSGVNDDGSAQNKREFAAHKNANPGVQSITGVGDAAFFNPVNGQMNILQGRDWLIVSYGAGVSPEANTVEDVTHVAQLVLK